MIIACKTISDELELALRETGVSYPIRWIDSGQHLRPGNLQRRLQKELDSVSGVKTVLLTFGYCGNALVGLTPPSFRMIFPRVDDCITLLLGSLKNRENLEDSSRTYFMTKGWMDGEKNIWSEYLENMDRYGPERTELIYNTLFANYKNLGLIETGAYDFQEFYQRTAVIEKTLGLRRCRVKGSLEYLKKFLTGPWDDNFFIIQPGETVTEQLLHFGKRQ